MSHTFRTESATFHFNSDFSGDIQIHAKHRTEHGDSLVDGEDILRFCGEIIRRHQIEQLESKHYKALILGN